MARILRLKAVRERTGLGTTKLYEMVKAGDFPSPVQLTARAVGWREVDVDAWINSRPKASKPDAHPGRSRQEGRR